MKARGVSGFRERVREIAKRVGSLSELARRAGLRLATVYSYVYRGSEPCASPLIALARAGNVSIEWLATGRRDRAGEHGRRLVKLTIDCDHIQIHPEAPIDRAFIEDTLGLRRAGDQIALARIDEDGAVWLVARRAPRRTK